MPTIRRRWPFLLLITFLTASLLAQARTTALLESRVVFAGVGDVVRAYSGRDARVLAAGALGVDTSAGARLAAGDFDGDGVPDLVIGQGGHVRVMSGATGNELGSGQPFGTAFAGGVSVAAGDVNGDGRADVLVARDTDALVRVYDGLDFGVLLADVPSASGRTGGVNVASADVNGDGRAELITAPSTGPGSVEIVEVADQRVLGRFLPYGQAFAGGVFVAAADLTGDGLAEVVVGPGAGAEPLMIYDPTQGSPVASGFPFGPAFAGGVRVAAGDVDGDGRTEVVAAAGPGAAPRVLVFQLGADQARLDFLAGDADDRRGVAVAVAVPPVGIEFTTPDSGTLPAGLPGRVVLRTRSAPAARLTLAGTLPQGVLFRDNGDGTATIDGTPAAGTAGASYSVVVTAANGVAPAASQAFTLRIGGVVLTSLSRSEGVAGTSLPLTLRGSGFVDGATTVTVSGDGVVAGVPEVADVSTLTVTLTIAPSAAPGPRTVTVTTAGGVSNGAVFTVLGTPTLTTITPPTGVPGTTVLVTLRGTGFFAGGTSVELTGNGVTASDVEVVSATTLTARFSVAATATTGEHTVTVTTAAGSSGGAPFTVIGGPSVTSFRASATHLVVAQPVRLSWAVANATGCAIDQGIGSVSCNGSIVVTPGASKTYTLTGVSGNASVAATADVTVGEAARFAYVANNASNTVSTASIDAATGTLTGIGGGTIAPGGSPRGTASDPAGRYLFVAIQNTNTLAAFTVGSDGSLTANGTIATGASPRDVVVDPGGRYVYVVNQSADTVSAYTINTNGTLAANGTTATGNQPIDAAVDPLGQYLYVTNAGSNTVSMYTIGADGGLSANGTVGTSNTPAGIVADPTGRYVYVGHTATNLVARYRVTGTGSLTSLGTTAFPDGNSRPFSVAVDPTGQYLYAGDSNNVINQVRAFRIDGSTGTLTDLGAVGAGTQPIRVAVDPAGKFVFVGNLGAASVSRYSINTDGTLTSLGAAFAVGTSPFYMALVR